MILSRKKLGRWIEQTIFVGPATLFFSIIVFIPFILGMYYSFTSWNGISDHVTWIGLKNFTFIFTKDTNFGKTFMFTVKYTITTVLLVNIVGFALALLVTRALKLTNLYRTIFFIPNVIGGLLLGYIFQFIFVNGFPAIGKLTGISIFNLPWLGTAGTGFWAIVLVSIWQMSGYMMVIYIAGLINVPKDLLEAAHIDGSTSWQSLRYITFPMIMPSITVCMFLTISNSFKTFDQILSLTGGGPFRSTEVVTLDIYNEAFTRNNMGLGAAKALIFFLIVASITLLQVWATKRKEVEA